MTMQICWAKLKSINSWYEAHTAILYPSLETVQQTVKMANSNKYAKKAKDDLFDQASGTLKDDIQTLITIYAEGQQVK